jgi:superoxide dismutase
MRYHLTPINTRPWLLNGLSLRLIESHYKNHYGGALRRLNAITEQLESLDFDKTPGYVVNSLKREELNALNSTPLHELYFASMAFGDGRPTETLAQALTRDFRSVDRWRSEFVAMAKGLAGGSGWVLLVYVPRDRRLINQYAGSMRAIMARPRRAAFRSWRSICTSMPTTSTSGQTRRRTSTPSNATSTGCRPRRVMRTRPRSRGPDRSSNAKYMKGGHSAWKAIGGPLKLYT